MRKRLILNLITLSITILLLIFISLAWYVSNKDVYANSIMGSALSDSYKLELQINDNNTWRKTDKLAINNSKPGDRYEFRIKFYNITRDSNVNISFSNISTSLDEHIKVYDSKICYLSDIYIPLYDVVNNQVIVDNNVLYEVNNNVVSVGDNYTLDKMFNYYPLGINNENYIIHTTNIISKNINTSTSKIYTLNNSLQILPSAYYYFYLDLPDGYSIYYEVTNNKPNRNENISENNAYLPPSSIVTQKIDIKITIVKDDTNTSSVWAEGTTDTFTRLANIKGN